MKRAIFYDLMRPMKAPSAHVPIGARSAGHYRFVRPFTCAIRTNTFVQLFWCIRGAGTLFFHGKARTLKAGQIAVYLPGMLHNWFVTSPPWEVRWVTFDGPLSEAMTVSLGLDAGVYNAGPCPEKLFRQLDRAIRRPTKEGEREASSLAIQILIRASACRHGKADSFIHDILERIHRDWSHRDLSVSGLAADCHAHRSVLTRRFRSATGVSPIQYINRVRMQNVLLLLQQTDMTVEEVAAHCGYRDAGYIARLTRRLTGKSPRDFRRIRGNEGS